MAKRGIGLGMHPFGLENFKSSDGGILQPGKGGLLAYQDQYKQYPPRFGRFANSKCRQNGHLRSLIEVRISFNTTSSKRKGGTPLKTNMEPENHPKENHLIQTSFLGSMLVFGFVPLCNLLLC